MNLLDTNGKVKKFDQVGDILKEYYRQVLRYQKKKKQYEVSRLRKIIEVMKYKAIFVKKYISGEIEFKGKKKDKIREEFAEIGIPDEGKYNEGIHNELFKMQVLEFSEELVEKLNKEVKELDEKKEWWRTVPE